MKNSFYLNYIRNKINERLNIFYKNNETQKNKKKRDCEFILRLNRGTSSLLICSLAFVTRYMYYYRVSKVDIWEYLNKAEFNIIYNDLRYMLLYLDGRAEELYKNYKNFKLYTKNKKTRV